ncbi:acylphosphatase [Actinomyces oris]|uniref:acylphosphatase n=1 Tax=Actinomyces oris TaxID=544580 RepID=A0AAW9KT48_9ACTO|nr:MULTISPECIES: acylphosphatase [Actinomyces]MEA1303767.1 acylphosphatase [Actinomyces oris]OLO58110.1 acylphosphatase [Actinomyces oris]OLO62707.1 acylphosphatase [Actinomyces oris]OLO64783.1 acylphosphatase [Actinomyces oris]OLO67889.1 acylphosphatase [Actinomyces oris]
MSDAGLSASTVRTVHVLVQGTVQGVGFRYHCAYTAQELGVVGRVRNLPDGDVEVMAQGEPEAVGRLIAWLRHGPRWASVRRLTVTDLRAGCLDERRFEITG